MLGYYLSSGVYGTTERGIKNRISGFREKSGSTSKFRYLVNRLFPDMEMYKSYYPFFYRHKLLLPIGWLYRLLRMIFSKKRRNSAVKEIGMVRKYEWIYCSSRLAFWISSDTLYTIVDIFLFCVLYISERLLHSGDVFYIFTFLCQIFIVHKIILK